MPNLVHIAGLAAAAACVAVLAPAGAVARSDAAAPGSTALTLLNGWTGAPYKTAKPTVALSKGLVRFKGAIANGTDAEAFVLPEGFRPAAMTYVKVDLCDAYNGRLIIYPSGDVQVQAETSFSEAQCFTSLDGASFAVSSDGFKPMKLKHGWSDTVYGTAHAAAREVDGVVHLQGAMSTEGTNSVPFTLPSRFRPDAIVYIPLDLCGATNGRLVIDTSGLASVEAENNNWANAQCFTSLEGAQFALTSSGYTALSLQNGWTATPYGTHDPAIRVSKGVVQFEGAVSNGTSSAIAVLPVGARPSKNVYIPVDLCDAHNGRLYITTDGTVSVEVENEDFAQAQCFTSLDGASFRL